MDKITRQAAIDRGLRRFFTGKPCLHGHIAERYTLQGQCCECQKLGSAGYKEEIKQRLKAARMRIALGRGGE